MTSSVATMAPTAPFRGARLYYLIAICATIAMLEGFDLQTISIAAPVLMGELGLDKEQTGQIFASGQAGLVLGALLGGIAGDAVGRRNALLIGVACFGVFCTSTVFATSYLTLIAARGLTGLGIGLVMPNLISMAVECAPDRHRGKTVSIILAGLPLGGMTVALVGSAYLELWGWRSLFYIGGLLPLAMIPLICLLPNYRPAHDPVTDRPKVGRMEALFGAGRATTTVLLWTSLLLTAAVLYMMLTWLPSLLNERGFDLRISHLASAMFSFGGCVGSFSMGFFVDRFGYRAVLPSLFVGVIAGIVGIVIGTAAPMILASSWIFGFFVVGAFYSLNGASPLYYPTASRSFGTGAAVGLGRVGSVFGPLLAGYVLQTGLGNIVHGPNTIPAVAIPLAVLACIATAWLTLRPTEPVAKHDLHH